MAAARDIFAPSDAYGDYSYNVPLPQNGAAVQGNTVPLLCNPPPPQYYQASAPPPPPPIFPPGEFFFPLTDGFYINVKLWHGQLYACIRRFRTDQNGHVHAQRTGVNLNEKQWNAFVGQFQNAQNAVSQLSTQASKKPE